MNAILAMNSAGGLSVSRGAVTASPFEWVLFLGFVGTLVTLIAWFARHVPKTDRPLAIPTAAFIGLTLVIVTMVTRNSIFGAILLSAVAAKEAAASLRHLKARRAALQASYAKRWSVDPSRMERLFGESVPRPVARRERPWRYAPEYRPDHDDNEGDPLAQPVE